MIFPEDYKTVGISREHRPGDPIYFATQYLLSCGGETALYRVHRSAPGSGFMVPGSLQMLAYGPQIAVYPQIIDTRNRSRLIHLAAEMCHDGVTTVVFKGPDEHVTFVHEPDPAAVTWIEILDVSPPDPPWLVYVIDRLEESGVLGDLTLAFKKRILDLRSYCGDEVYYPCRASGLGRSLDSDRVTCESPHIVGCEVSKEIFLATAGPKETGDYRFTNICPVTGGLLKPNGPFITRCCRSERRGLTSMNGHQGVVVHWGDGPHSVAEALRSLVGSLCKR